MRRIALRLPSEVKMAKMKKGRSHVQREEEEEEGSLARATGRRRRRRFGGLGFW